MHYRRALPATDGAAVAAWDTKTVSLLDALVGEKIAGRERSYSAPFSLYDFDKTTVVTDDGPKRINAKLKGAGAGVNEDKPLQSLFRKIEMGVMTGAVGVLVTWSGRCLRAARRLRAGNDCRNGAQQPLATGHFGLASGDFLGLRFDVRVARLAPFRDGRNRQRRALQCR